MRELNKETIRVLADWLCDFHSHGIYAAIPELKKLEPHFSLDVDRHLLIAQKGEIPCIIHLPLYTDKEIAKQIEARGLGGSVTKTDELLFGGYQMAESIAAQVADFHSGKSGRGSRYQECLIALRRAAE